MQPQYVPNRGSEENLGPHVSVNVNVALAPRASATGTSRDKQDAGSFESAGDEAKCPGRAGYGAV